GGKYPWNRDNRPGVRSALLQDAEFTKSLSRLNTAEIVNEPAAGVAPFELEMTPNAKLYFGNHTSGPCIGGGATAALRLAAEWQFIVDVSGCKLLDLPENLSGDSLNYLAGIRWTRQVSPRWEVYYEFLLGGNKLTQELVDP